MLEKLSYLKSHERAKNASIDPITQTAAITIPIEEVLSSAFFNTVLIINRSIYIVKLPNSSLFCEQHSPYLHKGTEPSLHTTMQAEAMEPKELARDAIAHFIRDASNSIPYGYWFTVRGECNSSLCVHTMLNLDQYAELLYIAGFIRIGK